ncbi:MAG TPA: hypothetical protein VH575_30915, partial [Gemmataceae bacterium]
LPQRFLVVELGHRYDTVERNPHGSSAVKLPRRSAAIDRLADQETAISQLVVPTVFERNRVGFYADEQYLPFEIGIGCGCTTPRKQQRPAKQDGSGNGEEGEYEGNTSSVHG